jgi:hypothetical protein
VVNYLSTYFVQKHSNATQKYTEDDIVNMINFLIDNIYVEFGGLIFQQVVGIPMGTNCAPLLADLFLYSYEADFIQSLITSGQKNLARSFNFSFRYIDDVLSLNNPLFGDYVDYIYPEELEIKDTTDADTFAAYLDLLIDIDKLQGLYIRIYDKRDDFNFPIVNFPFMCSNVPISPCYGVYISQLIRYSRACTLYKDFIYRGYLLSTKLTSQGYEMCRLISTVRKFYGRHLNLVKKYDKSVSQIIKDLFISS